MCYRPRVVFRVSNVQCPECGKRIDVRRKDNKNYVCFECKMEFNEVDIRKRCGL